MRRIGIYGLFSLIVALHPFALAETDEAQANWWRPTPGLSWQIQLDGPLDLRPNVKVFDLDLFDVPASTIARLKSRGVKVICYFNAGAYESWRPDAGSIPLRLRGAPVTNWRGERWLDIRRIDDLMRVMGPRLDLAKQKGCDAVDPDNVNGFTQRSGFPIGSNDQLRYNRTIASAAHARGLAVGLKNDLTQIPELISSFDFAVNEQCFQYRECEALKAFTASGKPVFGIEYSVTPAAFCRTAKANKFYFLMKRTNLGAWRATCG
jgi:hypothetical protein